MFHPLRLAVLTLLYVTLDSAPPIFPVSCELNVLIMLDRSDSVKGGFNQSRDFVIEVAKDLQIGPMNHQVAMILYSGLNYKREIYSWNFAKNNEDFTKKVSAFRAIGGTTNTGAALKEALKLMDRRDKKIPTVVMLVTDGRSADHTKEYAEQLRAIPNTYVFAGVAGDPKQIGVQSILDIAGDMDHVVRQTGRQKAAAVARGILQRAQKKCRTTTTSTTTTTTTTTTDPITGCEMDLVLVLDFSTTTSPIYKKYKSMAKDLVGQLKISPHHTLVSCVTFSSEGKTETSFNLKRFDRQEDVERAIDKLEYYGGTTNIGAGIIEGTNQREKEGARPDIATKVMVVFTDGWNNKGMDPGEAAKKATEEGFEVYTVACSDEIDNMVKPNMTTLHSIAEDENHCFMSDNFDGLIDRVKERNAPCMNGGVAKDRIGGKKGGRNERKGTTRKGKQTTKRPSRHILYRAECCGHQTRLVGGSRTQGQLRKKM